MKKFEPGIKDFETLRETAQAIIKNAERDLMIWYPVEEQIEKELKKFKGLARKRIK